VWNVETVQLWELRGLQGRRGELVDRLASWSHPILREWYGAQLVIALLDEGQESAARDAYAPVSSFDPALADFDNLWLDVVATVGEAAARFGDEDVCRRMYAALAPYAGSIVVVAGGVSCPGSVDHHLGVLARVQGEHDVARAHFLDAVALHEPLGSPPWVERSRRFL
jgi:hypothetical protein